MHACIATNYTHTYTPPLSTQCNHLPTQLPTYVATLARSLISRTSTTHPTQTFPNQPTNQPTNQPSSHPSRSHPSLPRSVVTLYTHIPTHAPRMDGTQTKYADTPRSSLTLPPAANHSSAFLACTPAHWSPYPPDGRTDGASSVRAAGSGKQRGRRKAEGGRRERWLDGWMDGWMDGWAFESVGFFLFFFFVFGRVSESVSSTGEYIRVCVVCGRVEKDKGE
ncbi:hypothetical protein IWX50DRAFT_1682 [Phyllosticta citricarpa]